ncbi:MAG: ferritin family protein, partial [Planctomycetota bacterium]
MNIFEYAMQMEKDGEDYYRQLAQQTANKGIRTILTMLADEEVKHYNAVEKMKTEKPQITETKILTDAKNVFVQIKESGGGFDFDIRQTELYKRAQDIEEKSRDF